MVTPPYIPLEWCGDRLRWIDQTALPAHLNYKESKRVEDVEEAIRRLEIRGAPLIGITALYAGALYIAGNAPNSRCKQLQSVHFDRLQEIGRVRPTAVNLMNAVTHLLRELESNPDRLALDVVMSVASSLHNYERHACQKIAKNGAQLLTDNSAILTHCNTGPLATGGLGTALGVILYAVNELGKKLTVYATETGPLRQGARLTVWELKQWGVPVTLIPDSAVASLLSTEKISAVIVGADRVARNGDFANKIGTAGIAANAQLAGVPFYTAFPWTTVDSGIDSGSSIPIEFRSGEEVWNNAGYTESNHPSVWNPAFDVTPSERVTNFITDRGVFTRDTFATYLTQPVR